jgi:hypothetical protein
MAAVYRKDGTVINAIGEAIAGALVYVCTQPASTAAIPPSPLAVLFADPNGAIPLANPVVVDGNGNFFFYATPGSYTHVYFDTFNRIPTQVYPDQLITSPGSGSVTSVGLAAPAEFTVSGSPVTGSGTLTFSKGSIGANLVAAGPSSGGPGTWTFRSLVPADFANQSANKIIAGPASGAVGPVTARSLVPADLPGTSTPGFSATPTFDASTANSFQMTLTGNVTSSTVSNPTPGQVVVFLFTQDGTGGRTFAWPGNFIGAGVVIPDPNVTSIQAFIYTGSAWKAVGALNGVS